MTDVHYHTAIALEMARCAAIADHFGDSDWNDTVLHNNPPLYCSGYERACRDIAAAIREDMG